MILTVNLGNTHITIGGYEHDDLKFCGRLHTDPAATVDEYGLRLLNLLSLHGVSPEQIEGGILGSVVPALTGRVLAALQMLCPVRILTVGPGLKSGIRLRLDNPAQLGAELLCGAVAALAEAEPEDIEAIVKPCGLGRSKARDISACMRVLRDKYNCKVPTTFEELLALPGVGRKSANLIMGDVFCKPAIVTDTHCIRLCNKIGLVDGIKEPQKVEMALWKIIPPEEGSDLCHRFVMHGRAVCNARKPECEKCCLNDICRYAAENAIPTKETKEASV